MAGRLFERAASNLPVRCLVLCFQTDMFRLFCFIFHVDYCLLPPNDSLLPPNDNLLSPNDGLLPANDAQTHLSPASMRWGGRENSLFRFKTLQAVHHKDIQKCSNPTIGLLLSKFMC
ncbi:hypothetical protein GCWU000325_01345 [Alloprevotella tannerae ATCC 51259]|uniref:Uncharacterized protein n=1 Tax=Alloprevotella tannerae ATCC 51259 TaxID=626522 RepID=C9LGK1_9BACT|nr:hypothetical protein GCWU000325_01345 [Alloprevotella tannerae ATCC 51259]